MIDARRDFAQRDAMKRVRAFHILIATLMASCLTGQSLSAATPLWELRAQKKQAEGQRKQAKSQPVQSEPQRMVSEIERVMGKEARTLVQLFGQPVQDVREAAARKLQFATKDCILDAYLYPPAEGRDPVVTYVAARVADGREAERNSCITALRLKR